MYIQSDGYGYWNNPRQLLATIMALKCGTDNGTLNGLAVISVLLGLSHPKMDMLRFDIHGLSKYSIYRDNSCSCAVSAA
jgi:hypothetical protein